MLEETKLVNQMTEGETCYYRPSGFAFVVDGEELRLFVETDFRAWISSESHNNIPMTLSGGKLEIPEEHRETIAREIALGAGHVLAMGKQEGFFPVVFTG